MADYDLEALSLGELKKMQKDVAKAISTFEDRQKAEARAKVEAIARDLGCSLAELVGTETKSSRAPAVAKYRHPETRRSPGPAGGAAANWAHEKLMCAPPEYIAATPWLSWPLLAGRQECPFRDDPAWLEGFHAPGPAGKRRRSGNPT